LESDPALPADQRPNRIVHWTHARRAMRHMRRCQLVPRLLRPECHTVPGQSVSLGFEPVSISVKLRTPICECVAAGVPQHVRVGLEGQLGCGTRALDHAGEAGGREGALPAPT
jgi:hypothetical protein